VRRDDDTQPIRDLEFAKARFAKGLKRCRALVAECRSRLIRVRAAANDDTPLFRWPGKPDDEGPQP
jgi:hypothetical protein